MQEITNSAWYAGNTIIKYPLDSNATGYSNDNSRLPNSLISDIRLTSTINKEFFIAGVTCSPYLISVVIASNSGLEAAITVPQPVKQLKHYSLQSFNTTTQGVIAFGSADEYGQWRFSSKVQSGLAPTCVFNLNPWPVTAIKVDKSLNGDVLFESGVGSDVSIGNICLGTTRCPGVISSERRAIIFRLEADYEEHPKYFGNCTYRADNDECGYILSLGGALPDSSGNINISIENLNQSVYSSATYTTYGTETHRDCKDPYTKSSVCINITDVPIDDSMKFGKCGADICECPSSTSTTFNSTPVTVTDSTTAITYINMENDVFPLGTIGLRYNDINGLRSESTSEAAIATVDGEFTYISVDFTITEGFECGILYNIDNESYDKFSYKDSVLELNNDSENIIVGDLKITLELFIDGNILTGNLIENYETKATLIANTQNFSNFGILLKNCNCTAWRVR